MPNLMNRELAHRRLSLLQAALTSLAAWAICAPSMASPLLSCDITQNGETRTVEFAPVADPYRVEGVDINERFRFKAVVVASAGRVDYVSLYAYYYLPSDQAVLLHQAKYRSPVVREKLIPNSLTGEHYLYSPNQGREMKYGCALIEVP